MNIDPSNQTKLYGHENHMNSLLKLYKKDYLPNKILFSGEKGVGKSTLAYHLINFIFSWKKKIGGDVLLTAAWMTLNGSQGVMTNTHQLCMRMLWL